MRRFFTKYGVLALSLAALTAVLLSLMIYFSNNTSVFTNLVNTVSLPFRTASTSIASWIDGKQRYAAEFDALKEENASLKEQIAEMEAALRQAEADSAENATLRRLLELRAQRRDLTWESAKVIERDTSNWASTLRLNAGTEQDIAIGDCVITASGELVGIITEAGGSWSLCTTLIDTESAVGCRIFRTGDVAVAEGDFSLMHDGLLKLNYLGTDAKAQVGDLVVTSGLGDYYPSELVIGYVQELMTGDDGLAQYAIVTPSVVPDTLEQVFVITDFDIVE